ncbi:17461_t:CDS:2 [Cetraspora pellucida]|uniref:17461_t:CDS:1 n=1 Tax=Cetraspora pellucida TaxID=1433469 RepID=A0A9N9DSH8_9GLOM|nr:17461_t:CDS:2 [Cetraspora pellucida]
MLISRVLTQITDPSSEDAGEIKLRCEIGFPIVNLTLNCKIL